MVTGRPEGADPSSAKPAIPARVALALAGFAVLLLAAGLGLSMANGEREWMDVMLLVTCANLAVGTVVAYRRPDHPVGWLLAVFGTMMASNLPLTTYAYYGIVTAPGSVPLAGAAAWVSGFKWIGELSLSLFFLPLLFPTGRLPSPAWRPVARAGGIAVVTVMVLSALVMPFTVGGDLRTFSSPLGVGVPEWTEGVIGNAVKLCLVACFLVAVASLVARHWRASLVERQQMRWLLYALAAMVAAMLGQTVMSAIDPNHLLTRLLDAVIPVTMFLVPASIGIAVLRYRLFQIDVIIKRTLLYGTLSAAVIATYLISVFGSQAILRAVTGQESHLAVVVSTLLAAAAAAPMRGRIQRALDRLFYRAQYDAATTLAVFGASARSQIELDPLTRELTKAVEDALKPEHVSVWLRRL